MAFAVSSWPHQRFDYTVVDPQRQPRLLVETKALRAVSTSKASAWRASWKGVDAPVLLVTPDRIFGWTVGAPVEQPPPLILDGVPFLSRYLTAVETNETIDPQVFEWAVGSWLEDLLAGDPQPVPLKALEDWLRKLPPGSMLVRQE